MINVFLRVYFDVFRQSSRFNFRPSKHSSFYVFGIFLDSRGGNRARYLYFLRFYRHYRGTPDKRISEGLFRFFLKIYIGGLYRHYRGGPLINDIVRVYFDVIIFFDILVGFYRHHRGDP